MNDFKNRYSILFRNGIGSSIRILFNSGHFGRYSILFRNSDEQELTSPGEVRDESQNLYQGGGRYACLVSLSGRPSLHCAGLRGGGPVGILPT